MTEATATSMSVGSFSAIGPVAGVQCQYKLARSRMPHAMKVTSALRARLLAR
jgi:hypothetical protein